MQSQNYNYKDEKGLPIMKYAISLLLVLLVLPVCAAERTFVKKYTYRASILDNQLTCRTISLRVVKQEILEELGTYVFSKFSGSASSDGPGSAKHEFQVITAGITKVKILKEDWDGKVYKLEAEIKADPDEVYNNINKFKASNAAIVEQIKQQNEEARLAQLELDRLRNELNALQNLDVPAEKQKEYIDNTKTLAFAEMYEEAIRYFYEGGYDESIALTNKLIEKGYLKGHILMGYFYASGKGIAVDKEKANEHYKLGFSALYEDAAKGNEFSQNMVGMAYLKGRGVAKDYTEALKWFHKAAVKELPDAESNIGYMYLKGFGVEKNIAVAQQWFEKASSKKYRRAVFWLGWIYEKGLSGSKDIDKAIEYYKEAARLNDVTSIARLGYLYEKGNGLDKDIDAAINLYRKGVELGGKNSMYRLGSLYEKGVGVERDMSKAIRLYKSAASLGLEAATKRLSSLGVE